MSFGWFGGNDDESEEEPLFPEESERDLYNQDADDLISRFRVHRKQIEGKVEICRHLLRYSLFWRIRSDCRKCDCIDLARELDELADFMRRFALPTLNGGELSGEFVAIIDKAMAFNRIDRDAWKTRGYMTVVQDFILALSACETVLSIALRVAADHTYFCDPEARAMRVAYNCDRRCDR